MGPPVHSIAQGILTHGFFLDQTLLLSDFAIQTVPRPSAGWKVSISGTKADAPFLGMEQFLEVNSRLCRAGPQSMTVPGKYESLPPREPLEAHATRGVRWTNPRV